jgi:hypothetical protein
MTLVLPNMPAFVTPLVHAIPIQLIAYHTAVIKGRRRRPAAQFGQIRYRRISEALDDKLDALHLVWTRNRGLGL